MRGISVGICFRGEGGGALSRLLYFGLVLLSVEAVVFVLAITILKKKNEKTRCSLVAALLFPS